MRESLLNYQPSRLVSWCDGYARGKGETASPSLAGKRRGKDTDQGWLVHARPFKARIHPRGSHKDRSNAPRPTRLQFRDRMTSSQEVSTAIDSDRFERQNGTEENGSVLITPLRAS